MQDAGTFEEELGFLNEEDRSGLLTRMEQLNCSEEREECLRTNYPGVFGIGLESMGRKQEYNEFVGHCKQRRVSADKFNTWILGFQVPHIYQLKKEGMLKHGVKSIKIGNFGTFKYTGDIDQSGKAYGYGEAVNDENEAFKGTF